MYQDIGGRVMIYVKYILVQYRVEDHSKKYVIYKKYVTFKKISNHYDY